MGDSLRLSQILINFITNAIKFTEHGQITIRIENLQHSVDKVLLNFSVSDTGIGLTPEQINMLFQNFQQVDSSTTRKYGGTGLGLSISKEFIELMGGTVGVTSEINKGSTFWFTLGFATPSLDDSNRVLCKQHPKPILIISNNALYCTAFKKLALSQHLTTDVAETALLGLDLIQQVDRLGQSYQFIFISSKIYEQENFTLFKKIKLLPITSQPKIILINQSGFNNYFVKTNDLFDGVLLKPTTPIGLSKQLSLLAENDIQQLENQPLDAFNKSLKQIAGATALIVDDNELNREVIALLLQEVGINCDFAENGLIAVNKITINKYDIVLMDVQMPIMDGLQATSEIRKLDNFKQLPIVALTANTAPESITSCLTIGMNDYLSKPIDPNVLSSTLIKWIKPREIIGETLLQDNAISIKTDPLMPSINGLDIADGLRRVLNNQAFYFTMLHKFTSNQRDFPTKISSALEKHEWRNAELIAHTLKGVAGNIGANNLSVKADILEKLIHNQDTSDLIDIACNQTNLLLNQLIEDIENKVLFDMEEDISIDNSHQNIEDLLKQIKQLLVDSDGDAVDLFNKNQAKIKARFPSYFLRLQDCASNYDFEEMILCLDEASKITNQNID
ncbi:MAG: ATP-binding protein [Methylococcales bacterium]|nr:ATP-binding protein [Methylococcales bacterium]